jgi:hypothetical protein
MSPAGMPQSFGLSSAKMPCANANYGEQYPKDSMTDTEECFGVFARMQTCGTDQSTQII